MAGIRLDWEGSVAILTIDRPEKRNAMGRPEIEAFTDAVAEARRNADLAALVVTGNGAFCAGGDLVSLRGVAEQREATPATYGPAHAMIRALLDAPAPTIAAIDGPAVGMGADIALACDCRLIGAEGWLRQGWAKYGAIPATGGVLFLQQLAPGVLWRLLDGQPAIDGRAAEDLGLGEAVLEGSARDAAVRRGTSYAQIPRPALRAYVSLARQAVVAQLDDYFQACATIQAELFNSSAFAERVGSQLGEQR